MKPLLTKRETADALGIPSRTFRRHEQRGAFRDLLARQPVGVRIYSGAAVARRLANHSTVRIGTGAQSW